MTDIIYQDEWYQIYGSKQGLSHIVTQDGVSAVVLNERDEVLLVKEPSPAEGGQYFLGLPGGALEDGEDPAEAINRELQEEIGYKAARLDKLIEFLPFSKYIHFIGHLYLARDLTARKLPGDEDYEIETVLMPFAELETWIAQGRIRRDFTIASLFMARSFLDK